MTLTAGIGAGADAHDLPASREEADEALALHGSIGGQAAAVAYDESWCDILLQRLRTAAAARRRPARGPVGDLRRHDAEHATHYLETLRAWLEAQGDLADAAGRLAVHQNTIRYRLRKMTELTDLDLEDPVKRFALLVEPATTT